jgi:hypothetical protein
MDLSLRDLERAVSIRRQIDQLEGQLNTILRGASTGGGSHGARPGLSPQTKAKIAASLRARWAKKRGGAPTVKRSGARKKGGITAAGRRRLSLLMKARWAARKKAGQVSK